MSMRTRRVLLRGFPWMGVLAVGVLAFGFPSLSASTEQGDVALGIQTAKTDMAPAFASLNETGKAPQPVQAAASPTTAAVAPTVAKKASQGRVPAALSMVDVAAGPGSASPPERPSSLRDTASAHPGEGGSGRGGAVFYTDPAAFQGALDAAGKVLKVIEDFEENRLPPNSVENFCDPLDSNTNEAGFEPGDIPENVSFQSNLDTPGMNPNPHGCPDGFAVLTAGYLQAANVAVGANFFADSLDVITQGHTAISMRVVDIVCLGLMDLYVFDANNNHIGTLFGLSGADLNGTFIGIVAPVEIGRINMTSPDCGGLIYEFAGYVAGEPQFGACCDDLTGVCNDNVPQSQCPPPLRFTANRLCADLDPPCVGCEKFVNIEIFTDNYPSETTWELVDKGTGQVVGSAGPLGDSLTLHTWDVCIDPIGGCYNFTIYDSYGDGICCDYGDGWYSVYHDGQPVCGGGEFGHSETCSNIGWDCGEGPKCMVQPPNQLNGIFSDLDCTPNCPTGMQILAENFVLNQEDQIDSLRWWGSYYPGDSEPDDCFTVIFRNDDGTGMPGDEINRLECVAPARVQTGVVLFGVHEWEYWLDLDPNKVLGPGAYFVEIYTDTTGNPDIWFWETGNSDPNKGIPGQAFTLTLPEPPWNYDAATDMALEVICKPHEELCGNGTVDPGEDCDPPDDAACPGECLPDCTCPGVECEKPACDGYPEGEPTCYTDYEDPYNGGCNSIPPVFQSINCGDMICGESGVYDGQGTPNFYRDTDWFEVIVPGPQQKEITWTVEAEFDVLIFIMDAGSGDCLDFTILADAAGPCNTVVSATATVDPGVYWLWVGPFTWDPLACGVQYTATIDWDCGGEIPAIVSAIAPNGAIDAAKPTDVDVCATEHGWDELRIVFDSDASGVVAGDFTITVDPADVSPPTICSLQYPSANVVRLLLCDRIPPGHWTIFTHDPSGTSTRLGYLPADANGDGASSPSDILDLIDHLNGVITLPPWGTDVDRNAATNSADILTLIDLLNGAGPCWDPWNGETLP